MPVLDRLNYLIQDIILISENFEAGLSHDLRYRRYGTIPVDLFFYLKVIQVKR